MRRSRSLEYAASRSPARAPAAWRNDCAFRASCLGGYARAVRDSSSEQRRNCVFTSAGDRNVVAGWLDPSRRRDFDLLVAFYGDDDARFAELQSVADRVWRIRGGKMQNLWALVRSGEIDLRAYDRIWVPDDDLILDPADVPRLFDLAERYDFWVCQPAFDPVGRISWPVTKVAENRNQVRLTDSVEITCPLFRGDKLRAFLDVYDGGLVGWGIDHWFGHEFGATWSGRFAVLDAIVVRNPRTAAKEGRFREIERLQPQQERAAAWAAVAAERGIRAAPGATLAVLPLPPGWREANPLKALPPPAFGRVRMSRDEITMFQRLLKPAPFCYLEWGVGGSTLMALRAGVRRMVTVESDAAWITAARTDPRIMRAEEAGRLHILHADIGPTGAWGAPLSTTPSAAWARYPDAPWDALVAQRLWPNLVLVDGRFRVACCLAVAVQSLQRPNKPPPMVLLHDCGPGRLHYDDALLAWDVVEQVGTLRLMRLKPGLDAQRLGLELGARVEDSR